jgi:hypothetical protein
MNSSSGNQSRTLAPALAQRFLTELANLRPEAGALARFRRQFDALIPERQTPFAAVETRPYRERLHDGPPAVPSETGQRAADALRTHKYRPSAASLMQLPPSAGPRTDREGPPTVEYRDQAPRPEGSASDVLAGSVDSSREGGLPPPLPHQRAASDTDTPSRGIPRGPAKVIDPDEQESQWIWALHHHLCRVWDQPDQRTREWGVFLLLLLTMGEAGSRHLTLLGFPDPLPPPTLFEQALMWFVDVRDRARHCPNPDCPAPYYFAKRRSQKYCSDSCALPAQREFKRRWWAEHGSTRRQGRPRRVTNIKKGR